MLVKINLRPNPVLIMPHGLAGVAHGFQYMSEGKVRTAYPHILNISFLKNTGGIIKLGQRREDYLPDRRYTQRVRGRSLTIERVWPKVKSTILHIHITNLFSSRMYMDLR